MNPNNIDPKVEAAYMATLSEEHSLTFTKGELLAMFNILTNVQLKFGDFKVIDPIIKKITPIVAVETNIPAKEATNPVETLTGLPKKDLVN